MAAFRVAARALTLERPHERYLSQRRRTGGHHSTLARRLKRTSDPLSRTPLSHVT